MAQNDFIVKNGLVVLNGQGVETTGTSSAALVVQGGIGSTGRIWSAGPINIFNQTSSTNSTTGALTVEGGVGIKGDLFVKNVNLLNFDDHVFYVSDGTGNDLTGDGRRVQSAFKTIKKALSVAQSGDTVFIESGTYTEEFPLTIPQGVSIKGAGLREVYVQPTTATNTQSAFLLNGETTISDFTVGGFYKPGYAFKFANSATITTRSPYIERFTVLTRGSNPQPGDPYGFDSNDAGGGAYLDGQNVTANSLESACLFNEATFIVPSSNALYVTNGVRVELLNGFSYFADKAIEYKSGNQGWGGQGRTRLKLANTTGTFAVGQNLYYIGSTGTVAASGQIVAVDSEYVYLNGKASGFVEASDRSGKVINVYNNAQISSFQRKFGTGSARFTTDGDFLDVVSDADLQYGTGAYTLETWVYLTENNRKQYLFNKGLTQATQFGLYIDSANKVTGQHGTTFFTGTTVLSTGTWYHVEMARDTSNNVKIFVGGNLDASGSSVANTNNGDSLTIGGISGISNQSLRGYMDEIRVSSIARHTSAFTPATASFNSDVATTLLIHADGADGSINFVDDGLGSQNVYSTTGTSTSTVIARAQQILLADYRQFGGELRCIGSAACYGNYGIYADGEGIDLKAIAFNMSYVGNGKDLSNDPTLTVQSNEIIKLNGAKVYYQTVDQIGDFRVGDQFRINQRTGNVDFGTANFRLGPLSSLTISDGVSASVLQPTSIQVGTLLFSAGRVQTITGNLILDPSGTLTTIESDLQVNGSLNFTGQILATSVANSTSTTTGALVVSGGVGVAKDLYVGGSATVVGNLNVLGVQTYVSSTATAVSDPVLELGGGPNNTDILINDGLDRGLLFNYNLSNTSTGATFTKSFFGMDNATEKLIYKVGVSVGPSGNLIQSFNGLGSWGSAKFGNLELVSGTTATGFNSGALQVTGGGSFSHNVYANRFFDATGLVLTTATIANFAVSSLTAGSDINVNASVGNITISNTSTLQTVTERGSTTTRVVTFANGTSSFSTLTGAVVIQGGLGVGGDIHAYTIFSNNSRVITESSLGNLGVTSLTAGTDTRVSTSTGAVTVWNESTLQSVTDRGSSTTNAILISNLTQSVSTDTGALVVAGGVGVGGDVRAGAVYSNGNLVLTQEFDTLETVTTRGASSTKEISFLNTSNSTLLGGGAVSISGGARVGKKLYVNDKLTVVGDVSTTTFAIDSRAGISVSADTMLQSWLSYPGGILDLKWNADRFEFLPVDDQALSIGANNVLQINGGVTNFVGINTSTPSSQLEVWGDIKGFDLYSNGSLVITNASLGEYGVTSLQPGDGISVNTTTGVVIVSSTETLQSITTRGNSTTNVVLFNSTAQSTSTTTGAVVVTGGVGIGSDLRIGGTTWVNLLRSNQINNSDTLRVEGISTFANVTPASGIDTGAVQIWGGASVRGDLYAGGLYDQGQRVVTRVNPIAGPGIRIRDEVNVGTATSFVIDNTGVIAIAGSQYIGVSSGTGIVSITNLGVQTLTAGTDTRVSASTGTITVWNTSTLQSVTSRGATTTFPIAVLNTTTSNTSTQGAFTVAGGVGIGGNLTVGGNAQIFGDFTVHGNQTYVNSTQTYVTDPVISLGVGPNNSSLSINDGYDRGLVLHYSTTSTPNTAFDNHAFLGMDNATQTLVFKTNVYPGGTQDFSPTFSNTGTWGLASFGGLRLRNLTSATSANTGALIVDGGAGIAGSLYVGDRLFVNGNEVLTSGSGGVGSYVSAIFAGTDTVVTTSTGIVNIWNTSTLRSITERGNTTPYQINITNTTNSTSTNSGALLVSGGVGIGGSLVVGGTISVNGVEVGGGSSTFPSLTITGTDAASSTSTGALKVAGGIGVGKNIVVGSGAITRGISGANVFANGSFDTPGDAQAGIYVLRSVINSSLYGALTTDGTVPGSANQVILPNNATFTFKVLVTARETTTDNEGAWEFNGVITRGLGASTTQIKVSNKTKIWSSKIDWDVVVEADTINGGLRIKARSTESDTVRYVARVDTVELSRA